MVSLRDFIERSDLQRQLQEKLEETVNKSFAKRPLATKDVKDIISVFMQTALENYIAQVTLENAKLSGPEELRDAIDEIAFYLSPESQVNILENCNDEQAYRLGRVFYNLSKKQLPC